MSSVVDASARVAFHLADDPRRERVVAALAASDTMYAPAHMDVEVVSAPRNLVRPRPRLAPAIPAALRHLAGLPIRRMALAPLLDRIWELHENVSAYDAGYVALAERSLRT